MKEKKGSFFMKHHVSVNNTIALQMHWHIGK